MDSYNFTSAENLFVKAALYNWDNGNNWLYQTLNSEHCDKATALMIYWRSAPNFYYGYALETDIPEWAVEGYKLMKATEKLLLENNFSETISYTPEQDRIPKEPSILNKIPHTLMLPTKGTDGNVIIKNYIEADYLIEACGRNGNLEEVQKRLEKNSYILNLCINDKNPLLNAVDFYNNKNIIALVTFLIEKGADVNAHPSRYPQLPILFRCIHCKNSKLIELLVKNGAEINAVNFNGETILHKQLGNAVENWKKYFGANFLKKLLFYGANPNQKNTAGKTPIDLAKENNNETAIKIIEKFLEIKNSH